MSRSKRPLSRKATSRKASKKKTNRIPDRSSHGWHLCWLLTKEHGCNPVCFVRYLKLGLAYRVDVDDPVIQNMYNRYLTREAYDLGKAAGFCSGPASQYEAVRKIKLEE